MTRAPGADLVRRRRVSKEPQPRAETADLARLCDADVVSSPLYRRLVFVLAPPGSGAETVVAGLASLTGVAVRPRPMLLFSQGLGRVLANLYISAHAGAREGLSAMASEGVVLAAVRELGDTLVPHEDTGLLVDYSPADVIWAEAVEAVYPDACLVHVVRDGRVAATVAPGSTLTAAREWSTGHRAVLRMSASARVVRVDYEHLTANPASAILPLLETLDRADEVDRAVAAIVAADRGENVSPSRRAIHEVEATGADLLDRFGYPIN